MGFGHLNACAIEQICLTDKHTDTGRLLKKQAFATQSKGKASKPPNTALSSSYRTEILFFLYVFEDPFLKLSSVKKEIQKENKHDMTKEN